MSATLRHQPNPVGAWLGRRAGQAMGFWRRIDPDGVWQSRLFNLAVAAFVGYILGQILYRPNPRIVKAIAGFTVLYAAWKFPIPVSLSVFLIMFPFPFAITYGSSNTIFVFIITSMWLAQIVLRTERPVGRSPFDMHIFLLLSIYLLSFGNVTNSFALMKGIINFSTILATIFVYYLIVHSVRDEKTLRRVVNTIMVMAVLNYLVAIWELLFPGRPIIRGWILSGSYYDPSVATGLRVGGAFQDFELFGEFCALMLPLSFFFVAQARNKRDYMLRMGLLLWNFVTLMATVTRGATISAVVGMLYLLYLQRKSLGPVRIMAILSVAFTLFMGVSLFLSLYTVSGSVVDRLLNTKMVNGMPDSRTFWPDIFRRCFEHVWVGHGPYYEFGEYGREKLAKFFWPHNGFLYYFHTVGLFGVSTFTAILVTAYLTTRGKMWEAARVVTDSSSARRVFQTIRITNLGSSDYCRGLMVALNTMVVIFAVDQMKIEYLRSETYQFWPWIMFGLIAATSNVMATRAVDPILSPGAGSIEPPPQAAKRERGGRGSIRLGPQSARPVALR